MAKKLSEISVLMISLDPQFLQADSAVFERHRKYAQHLKRLEVIVMAGPSRGQAIEQNNYVVRGVGGGLAALWRAYYLAKVLFASASYDLIDTQHPHAAGLIGCLLARRFHKPLEVHFHGDFWNNDYWLRESWKNRIYNLLQKIIVRQASAIRVVSPIIKDKLLQSGIAENKIAVINTPINEELFGQRADATRVKQTRDKYNKKILLFVGRLVPAKNLAFMLRGIKELKDRRDDFVLLIIGEGAERNKLLFLIEQYHLTDTVFLLGEKESHHLLDFYQAAYLNLLLSTNESFGKVIIEAGWKATPKIASHTLGAETIISDKRNGWLVPINHLPATIDKLDLLLSDQSAVQRTGQRAQTDFLENYNQAKTYQKILDFWQKIVS